MHKTSRSFNKHAQNKSLCQDVCVKQVAQSVCMQKKIVLSVRMHTASCWLRTHARNKQLHQYLWMH